MNTRECLDMKLRPGNAGSNTFSDHKEVLDRGAEAGSRKPSGGRSSSASTARERATTW